ncbi:MAG: general secretion pathway protein [Blastopirellula sp.]|nr:MAG: general secretion pathway protein [Blastopirellula sp.]
MDASFPDTKDGLLYFAFEATPWRDVIDWLAEESHLALHVGDLPTGSFTYSDPNSFTQKDAIDRINLFLLPQGFTLVRSGDLLSVINLSDPRSLQQLEVLAKLVTADQLEEMSDNDVVKCIFTLGEINAEDAIEELNAFKLMTTPSVFSRTNRIMITDTVAKLKTVKLILDAFQPSELENGTVMKNIALQHVDAEDILIVARPHLGLATGEMIGIDVSISADLQGKNLFVTGVEDKVKLIEGLVEALDVPDKTLTLTVGESELRTHLVHSGEVESVYNVLQTLLADKPVRLSMDRSASTIVALASTEVQNEIEQTVLKMQGSEAEFEVIQLKVVDPYYVITLLEQMLDLPDPLLVDPEDIDPDAPKIDADPGNMRLFVRAKKHQLEQIRQIVAKLDVADGIGGSAGTSNDGLIIIPLKGRMAEQALENAAKFWQDDNPIILYPSLDGSSQTRTERVVADDSSQLQTSQTAKTQTSTAARILGGNIRSEAVIIRCQVTSQGILLQSEDTDALSKFSAQLKIMIGPVDSLPSPPVVFYLKYTKPDDAIRVLAELLDGGEAASEGEAGSLINGYVSSSPGSLFLSSFVTSRSGTTTMTSGTITVVADSRLNRLIAQGTEEDIQLIESYLKVIDKDNSITAIETYGKSHLIELVNTRASVVADLIRDAYAGRISKASAKPGQPGSQSQPQPSSNDKKAAPVKKPTSSQAAKDLEPKMTIAVHEPSNSLIVTAPEQLFKEIEQLVKLVDTRSEQTTHVISSSNASIIQPQLQQILYGTGTSSARPSSKPSSSSSTSKKGSSK